jgi:antitoxin component YwqK of YwqJK toxin-antitoxin module
MEREKISELGDGRQLVKIYGKNGELHKEFVRKGNKIDGYYKVFFANGRIEQYNNFSNDTFDGQQKMYFENGNVKLSSFYRVGKIDSIQKWYYSNGAVKSEFFWMNGKRFGVQKQFDSATKLCNIYFLNSCDSCMTLDMTVDTSGKVTKKKGTLVSAIVDKTTVFVNDTTRILFYAVTTNAYTYRAKLIEKDRLSGKRKEQPITLSEYNNNKGYFLYKKYGRTGKFLLGVSISLSGRTSGDYLEDSTFVPISVIKD